MALGSINILTTLSFLIHEHGCLFNYLCVALFLLSIFCSFQQYTSFTYLVNFFSTYFIISDAAINGIVFKLILGGGSLLMHTDAINFFLILFLATSLNIHPNSFFPSF